MGLQETIQAWQQALNTRYLMWRYRDWFKAARGLQCRVVDLPAGMAPAARRVEAERWFMALLGERALPQWSEWFSTVCLGFGPLGEKVIPSWRETCTRGEWVQGGLERALDALDAWPSDRPVTLFVLPSLALFEAVVNDRAGTQRPT